MQPIRFPSIEKEAVGQQSPGQRLQQLVKVDFVSLVNDALININEGQWEPLEELLGRIIEIIKEKPLLEKQLAQIKALVRKLPDQFAQEKITLACVIADHLSSRPLTHRLGRDGLGQPIRWECDLLLSMQWLQAAIGLSKKIGKMDLLNLLYNQADRLFARFVLLEGIETDERERIQVVQLCQENTAAFREDLATIANENDLSMRAKQMIIFNRYRHYFQETFVPHLQTLLGPPPSPCRYHVLAMGSVGRGEITPLTNLECCILMEERKLTEEEKNRDNHQTLEEIYRQENEENRRYFKKMGRLLELLVLSIGEWFTKTIPPLDLQRESLMKGFHITPTKGSEESSWESNVLVVTSDEAKVLILKKENSSYPEEEFAKYGHDKGENYYSLLKSASLYSSDGSEELFQDYQREIEQLLCRPLYKGESVKNCGEKIIHYTLQKRRGELLRYHRHVFYGTVDLKEIIFRPFTLLLTDLHISLCRSGESTATLAKTNTLDLIDELTPLFTSDSLELLKILAKELHSLRIKLHTFYGVARGTVKDEASFDGMSLTHYTLTSQQQIVIHTAHELILQPLYAKIGEVISPGYLLSPIDLIHEGVKDVLQLFQHGKNDELNHRFRLWMALPIAIQLSFYRALSAVGADEHLREIFIDDIEKILSKEQLEIFLQVPHSITGYRQKERIARRDLQEAILAITTATEETPYLIVTPFIHEPRYLKRTVADSVIDRGELKAEPKHAAVSGNRVCSLSHEGINLHFKQAPTEDNGSPFFPGKEQGVNRLMMRLFGRGCPFSELVYLTNRSTQKGYFVLISQTVFGINLNDIIEDPLALAQVDRKQLTELFLSVPLVLPGNHRPVNFMMESTIDPKGQTSSQLICVDNDAAWVRPIQSERNFIGQVKYTINIYTPLFFLFPNFNLNEEAIKEFLRLRPTSLLKAWFEEMIALNASYQQTFGQYLPSVIFPYFALEKGMGGQLFVQFCYLQSYLQKHFNRAIEAEELFNTFISYENSHSIDVGKMLFEKYAIEKNTTGSVSDKMKRITGRDLTKSLRLSQSTKVMFSHLNLDADVFRPEQSIKELNFLSLYVDRIRIVQQENDLYNVERGFSKVVLPDGSPDLATQAALIDAIAAIRSNKLDLSHCPALTDAALIRIFETSGRHLTYLNLIGCPSITDESISLLTEHCPYLEELYLSGCPRLTSLSSRNLVGLKTEAYLLFLRVLHISRCNQLTAIDLHSYALTTVKADNNPNLTDVDLDTLEIPDTHFAHCPKLKPEWSSKLVDRIAHHTKRYGTKIFYVLAQVYRNDSSLTMLDLNWDNIGDAGTASLAEALQHNSSLTMLHLANNNIGAAGVTSLVKALKHNSSLKTLYLQWNNIGTNGAVSLSEALHYKSSLTTLNLTGNNIGTPGAASLALGLQYNSSLRTLDLSSNNINAADTASLAKALQHNKSLIELNLRYNNFGNVGTTCLALGLQHNSSLKTVNLGSNNIGDTGAVSLAKALQHNSSLSTLNLYNNNIGNTGATSLAETLQHNRSLARLDLRFNNIGDAGAASLAKALRYNSSLTELNLGYNNISNAGAASLAEALQHNGSLIKLDLGGNNIDTVGTISLAVGLQHNSSLTTLNLQHNGIGDTGAVSLAKALRHNSSLTTLDLEMNNIGDTGTVSLAEALQYNSSLAKLYLQRNNVGAEGIASLGLGLQRNNSLTTLTLYDNSIGNTEAASLSEALQYNSSLTTLDLWSNNITATGVTSLAKALQHNNSLTTLDLTSNNIGADGAIFEKEIEAALERNKRLKAKEALKTGSLPNAILVGAELENSDNDTPRQVASSSSAASSSSSSSSLPSEVTPHSDPIAAAREAYLLRYHKKSPSEDNDT